jgi:Skp family chaperone for outer membrane proteins
MYVLLYVLTAAMPGYAATYKWTDENGETVYSNTPPPDGARNVEKVKNPPPRSSKSASEKTKEDAAAFNERREDRKTAEQDQKKMQQAEAERKKQCEQMRQDVETLTTKPVVRRASEDGGEPVVLTGEEREAEVKELRESIKKNCK